MVQVFGIRHHGPGSARRLLASLEAMQPDIILLELPADCQAMLLHLQDKGIVPPVSLLYYTTENANQTAMLPFAVFSPEWQAIQFAFRQSIAVVAIDLPMHQQLEMEAKPLERNQPTEWQQMQRDPLGFLGQLAGYRDGEAWWESVLEHDMEETALFPAITAMMYELRAGNPPSPLNEARENHMWQQINRYQQAGYTNIAVVCGAWHAPVLDPSTREKYLASLPSPSSFEENYPDRRQPGSSSAYAIVPITYEQLSVYSGYGAGVHSPAWYELVFTNRREAIIRFMVQAAKLLRTKQWDTSPAAVVEAVQLTQSLTVLRGKKMPGLEELQEAALSVLCQGAKTRLDIIHRKLIVGENRGKVPVTLPQAPLLADMKKRVKKARLSREYAATTRVSKTLDIRLPANLEASRLFHQLRLLDVHWAKPGSETGRELGTFQEYWSLKWKLQWHTQLIVAGAWGTNISQAAANSVRKKAVETHDVQLLCSWLDDAIRGNISEVVSALLAQIKQEIALANDLKVLKVCLLFVYGTLQYSNLRQTDKPVLEQVLHTVIPRICLALPSVVAHLDELPDKEWGVAIKEIHRAIQALEQADWQQQWLETMNLAASSSATSPFTRGKCAQLLTRKKDDVRTEKLLFLPDILADKSLDYSYKAAFIEGYVHDSMLWIVYEKEVVSVLGEWVSGLPKNTFLELLPIFRRAFSEAAAGEKEALLETFLHQDAVEDRLLSHSTASPRSEYVQPLLNLILGEV